MSCITDGERGRFDVNGKTVLAMGALLAMAIVISAFAPTHARPDNCPNAVAVYEGRCSQVNP